MALATSQHGTNTSGLLTDGQIGPEDIPWPWEACLVNLNHSQHHSPGVQLYFFLGATTFQSEQGILIRKYALVYSEQPESGLDLRLCTSDVSDVGRLRSDCHEDPRYRRHYEVLMWRNIALTSVQVHHQQPSLMSARGAHAQVHTLSFGRDSSIDHCETVEQFSRRGTRAPQDGIQNHPGYASRVSRARLKDILVQSDLSCRTCKQAPIARGVLRAVDTADDGPVMPENTPRIRTNESLGPNL